MCVIVCARFIRALETNTRKTTLQHNPTNTQTAPCPANPSHHLRVGAQPKREKRRLAVLPWTDPCGHHLPTANRTSPIDGFLHAFCVIFATVAQGTACVWGVPGNFLKPMDNTSCHKLHTRHPHPNGTMKKDTEPTLHKWRRGAKCLSQEKTTLKFVIRRHGLSVYTDPHARNMPPRLATWGPCA